MLGSPLDMRQKFLLGLVSSFLYGKYHHMEKTEMFVDVDIFASS